jgi:hypothetical protein
MGEKPTGCCIFGEDSPTATLHRIISDSIEHVFLHVTADLYVLACRTNNCRSCPRHCSSPILHFLPHVPRMSLPKCAASKTERDGNADVLATWIYPSLSDEAS